MADRENYWIKIANGKYSRRSFLRMTAGVGAGYAGLSLVGCGGGTAKPSTSSAPAAKDPKYGGTLHWFNPGDLPHMDPFDVAGRLAHRAALGVVYDRLVDYDWSGGLTSFDEKIIPRLAEGWTNPDETTFVFKLRQGIKWHDGAEFSSADVKFTYDFVMDPKANLDGRSILEAVGKVEAPDNSTIKISLKRPSAAFLGMLTNDAVPIVPRHLLEKNREGLAEKPVGTGPFMVEKLDPATGVVFKKNPYYYVKGRPYLDGMTLSLITDWSAKAAAFMSKQIDLHIVPDKPQFEAIKAAVPDLLLRTSPSTPNSSLVFSSYVKPPFNDIRVRRAFLLAINQKGLIDRIWSGEGTINPPIIAGAWKKWSIPQEELTKMPGFRYPNDQDVAEAKRLLAEAGYANGMKVVTICNADASVAPKNLQVVAEHLRAAGVTVEQQCLERTTFNRRARAVEFDIALSPYTGGGGDPDRRLFPFVYTNGASNYGKLSDPKLDDMIEKQSRLFNEGERRKILLDIQRYMIEQAYQVPTPDPYIYGMTQSYVRGYNPAYMGNPHPHLRSEAEGIWLDK